MNKIKYSHKINSKTIFFVDASKFSWVDVLIYLTLGQLFFVCASSMIVLLSKLEGKPICWDEV